MVIHLGKTVNSGLRRLQNERNVLFLGITLSSHNVSFTRDLMNASKLRGRLSSFAWLYPGLNSLNKN